MFNNIVQSKKYLVEVDDEKGNQKNPAAIDEEEGIEEENEEDATIDSKGICYL